MAQKRSKKKRPSREKYIISEQLKIEQGVFDNRTMMSLSPLFTHGIISKLYFLTARGKEADIYIAEAGQKIKKELVIVKIFRIETSGFERRLDYIFGDPRFENTKQGMYQVVYVWCKKEYGNLKLAEEAKVNAPKPYMFSGNTLAMEFVGDNGVPASSLKDTKLDNPNAMLSKILREVGKLYSIGLVHSDLSEYNILIKGNEPYLIDFGQAVVMGHPKAIEFFNRDIENILTYFYKVYGIHENIEEIISKIKRNEQIKI
jgi:RIO kinase 1